MKLIDLIGDLPCACPEELRSMEIGSVSTHSEEIGEKCLFVAVRGLKTDGHSFISQAVLNGAACILAEEDYRGEIPDGVPLLRICNTRRAVAEIYYRFYGAPTRGLKLIGVTGTNGKTSIVHLLRAILEQAGHRCGVIGTVGCELSGQAIHGKDADPLSNMTTPDPPQLYRILREMADGGAEYVVMETTSHALALDKLSPLRFAAGIFTNLTPEHLDFHGTMERYAAEKAKLFSACELAVLNGESPYAEQMRAACRGPAVICGGGNGDVRAEQTACGWATGVSYDLVMGAVRLPIRCPIPGSFTVMNSMLAAVCALELGVGAEEIRQALEGVSPVRGRMERISCPSSDDVEVIVDYAHTPDALEMLLREARKREGKGRITLVFGCGGERDRGKRPLMGAIAQRYAHRVILTADNSRSESTSEILSQIRSGMSRGAARVIPNRREAIRTAILEADAGDLILLAGKGHEEYEINGAGRFRFSEREIAAEALRERRKEDIPL